MKKYNIVRAPIFLVGISFGFTPALAASLSVVTGSKLFIEETFGGNGTTCSTCHVLERGYTIDPEFISGLSPSDVLFLPETDTNVAGREIDSLVREFALFATEPDTSVGPIRAVNHIAGLAGNSGWGGNKTLTDITNGAIKQHAPKSLARVEGVDFRFATATEITDMINFMTFVSGRLNPSITTSTFRDAAANRGRTLFNGVNTAKCVRCHTGTTALNLAGNNASLDTGAEKLSPMVIASTGETLPVDPGNGSGQFNFAPVLGGTGPYFHNNGADTIRDVVKFYASQDSTVNKFNTSPAGVLVGGILLTDAQIDDVTKFVLLNTAVTRINAAKVFLSTDVPSNDGAKNTWLLSAEGAVTVAIRSLREENLSPSAQTSLVAAQTGIESMVSSGGTDSSAVVANLNTALGLLVTTSTRPPRR